MATVTKRGPKFLARVRRDGFRPVSQTFSRRSDAVSWGRKVEADMEAGRWQDRERSAPTLAQAIEQYRDRVAVNMKGARDYRYAFRQLEGSPLAAVRVDAIKPAELADWRDRELSRGMKNATVARRLGMLGAVLTWCQKERGWIESNPMRAVRKPIVRDARTRTLDNDEARYLDIATRGARAAWLADAVTVLLRSAMRRSELVSLLCADVDLSAGVARLRDSKNGEARAVPLCPVAIETLRRLIAAAREQDCETVLPIRDPEAVSFAFRRAVVRAQDRYREDCAAAGREPAAGFLEGVRLHDLRHHAITHWATTGALSLPELMAVSGHKSPGMLARYVNLSASTLAGKMARVAA